MEHANESEPLSQLHAIHTTRVDPASIDPMTLSQPPTSRRLLKPIEARRGGWLLHPCTMAAYRSLDRFRISVQKLNSISWYKRKVTCFGGGRCQGRFGTCGSKDRAKSMSHSLPFDDSCWEMGKICASHHLPEAEVGVRSAGWVWVVRSAKVTGEPSTQYLGRKHRAVRHRDVLTPRLGASPSQLPCPFKAPLRLFFWAPHPYLARFSSHTCAFQATHATKRPH